MKEKMLLKIDRDRLRQTQLPTSQPDHSFHVAEGSSKPVKLKTKWSPLPTLKPFAAKSPQPVLVFLHESKCTQLHQAGISRLAVSHSTLAAGSDDQTITIISDNNPPQILHGHKSFVSGLAFHNNLLLSSSGDGELKIWDESKCIKTLHEHTSCAWSIQVAGDYALTASMDHTAKLIDLACSKTRHTFRGHVDSVNSAIFTSLGGTSHQQLIITGSADKSVSLWDPRTTNCIHTFFQHTNSVSVISSLGNGGGLVSADLVGILYFWDIKVMKERLSVCVGSAVNGIAVCDKVAAVASGSSVMLLDTDTGETKSRLEGHEGMIVLDCVWNPVGVELISGDSNGMIRYWVN